jgi:ribosomal protein S1
VKITDVDAENKRISLSIRALLVQDAEAEEEAEAEVEETEAE